MSPSHPNFSRNTSQPGEVQEINIPFVPNKVDLNHLDSKGNLLSEMDRHHLINMPATDNIIYGKKIFSREDVSRRPAIVNGELSL